VSNLPPVAVVRATLRSGFVARRLLVTKEPSLTNFTDLGLCAPILEALAAENYVTPTPIQAQAIPQVLAGRDLLGIAQTGTGKTAAFALPILHRLAAERRPLVPHSCRVLVLAPTRELASQIEDSFRTYGRHLRLTSTVVFGGVDMRRQERAMARGVDILVATPGRLIDHMNHRTIRLDRVETVVLDEVDRMLDIGFIHAIRRVMSHVPAKRQSLFFSATLPKDIAALAAELLTDPARVSITPVATTAERVDQQVIHLDQPTKKTVLAKLLSDPLVARAIVFTRTKHRADQVARHLEACGVVASAIHGNKSQSQRERALGGFRDGRTRVLVATDIAARGIDVDGISHVVNFDLPDVPESYVHRIGRTARAGAEGRAIAFCSPDERDNWRAIENLIRQKVPVLEVVGSLAAPADRASGSAASRGNPAPRRSEPARDGHRPPRAPRTAAAPAPAWQGGGSFRSSPRPTAAGEPRGRTGARRA
jgi:ATP-dependent RNA helicase RhlE